MALLSTDAPPRIPASGSPAASAWRCLTISRTRWSMFGSGLQVGSGMTPALRSMKYSCQVASPILSNCEWMICPEDRNTTTRRSNSVGRVENHSVGVRRGMPRVRSVMGAFLFYFFGDGCCYFDQSSSFSFSVQIARRFSRAIEKGRESGPCGYCRVVAVISRRTGFSGTATRAGRRKPAAGTTRSAARSAWSRWEAGTSHSAGRSCRW